MNGKKYFVAAIVLNTVLLAFAACLCRHFLCEAQAGDGANEPRIAALLGPGGKFGPVKEITLPASDATGRAEIVDLETGRALPQERFEHFNFRADAIMGWIHSHGLDISCNVWSGGAACVTYDMTVVAVEGKRWKEASEQELIGNPALVPVPHSPRKLLVLGQNRPDTYMFRTGEGTLGMLRIVGLNENGQGVKICYKLINPAKSLSAAL
jgi:hypothetical protein